MDGMGLWLGLCVYMRVACLRGMCTGTRTVPLYSSRRATRDVYRYMSGVNLSQIQIRSLVLVTAVNPCSDCDGRINS